jgi:hypothetical protein
MDPFPVTPHDVEYMLCCIVSCCVVFWPDDLRIHLRQSHANHFRHTLILLDLLSGVIMAEPLCRDGCSGVVG